MHTPALGCRWGRHIETGSTQRLGLPSGFGKPGLGNWHCARELHTSADDCSSPPPPAEASVSCRRMGAVDSMSTHTRAWGGRATVAGHTLRPIAPAMPPLMSEGRPVRMPPVPNGRARSVGGCTRLRPACISAHGTYVTCQPTNTMVRPARRTAKRRVDAQQGSARTRRDPLGTLIYIWNALFLDHRALFRSDSSD